MAKKKHTLAKTLGGLFVSGAAALALTNQILIKKEKESIYNYGTKVETIFGKMNVAINGEGEDVIVLLSGYGTTSPILDFEPLAKSLSSFAKVITVEYLGYGDSDDTDRERTVENICEELHCLLETLHVNKYWLMPHSISGAYALAYVNYYPEEVAGLLMIDTSVPKQVEKANPKIEAVLTKVLSYSGLNRIITHFNSEGTIGSKEVYDEDVLEQIKYRSLQNPTKAIKNEGDLLLANMQKCVDMKLPEKLPVLTFLCKSTIDKTKNWWLELHEEQNDNLETSAIVVLEGTHYLHRTNAETMANEVDNFMAFNAEATIFE